MLREASYLLGASILVYLLVLPILFDILPRISKVLCSSGSLSALAKATVRYLYWRSRLSRGMEYWYLFLYGIFKFSTIIKKQRTECPVQLAPGQFCMLSMQKMVSCIGVASRSQHTLSNKIFGVNENKGASVASGGQPWALLLTAAKHVIQLVHRLCVCDVSFGA